MELYSLVIREDNLKQWSTATIMYLLVGVVGSVPLELSASRYSVVLVGGAHLVVHGSLWDDKRSGAGDGVGLELILGLHGVSISLVGHISSSHKVHKVRPANWNEI